LKLRAEYLTSMLGSIFLAHYYALLERWMDFSKVHEWVKYLPIWRGVSAYQYIFMLTLFILIGALPLIDNILFHRNRENWRRDLAMIAGNALLIGLNEDAAYFYLYGEWLKPCRWVTHIVGYLRVGEYAIPNWYFIFALAIVVLYSYAFQVSIGFRRWVEKCLATLARRRLRKGSGR